MSLRDWQLKMLIKTTGKKKNDILIFITNAWDRYGLECLFRFYSYGLEKTYRKELFQDFQELTLADYDRGHLYGLEKFWAYNYYRKDKNKRKLKFNERMTELLNKYKTIEDFRNSKVSKQVPDDTYKVPHHGVSNIKWKIGKILTCSLET